ncbi:MAG TPA: peptide deformylase [Thermoanaerobaculia bacterium]|nr:peptide deformylase [Thermoanaerobaculia bacterium]
MATLPIVRLGHPALRTAARPLDPSQLGSEGIQNLIDDMIETMRSAGGVGIAAPQLGVELQVFVYEAGDGEGSGIPLTVAVNPLVTPQQGELVYDWEGCLSIPDLRGLVPRHPAVKLSGLDRQGRPFERTAADFEARIIQHENDHLNGIVFLDRMRDLKSLAYLPERERYWLAEEGEPEDETVG